MTWVTSTSLTIFGAGSGGYAGEDSVGSTGQDLEHAVSVVGAEGLTEDVAVADDAGVGAEDDERVFGSVERAAAIPDGLGLLFGEALDVGGGDLVGETVFVDVG